MDNLTHTLAGVLLADTYLRKKPNPRKAPFYVASILANNFPDLDVFVSFVKPLSLVHHRGYSHTLLACAPMTFLLVLGFLLYGRNDPWYRRNWKDIALISVLGNFFHLFLDYWNSYGLHPFVPFSNHWIYGDSIFILEPLLWILLSTYFLFRYSSKLARILSVSLIALSLRLSFHALVPDQLRVFAWVFATCMVGYFWRTKFRLASVWALSILFVGFYFLLSGHIRSEIEELLHTEYPDHQIHDIVVSPYPMNFLCWTINTVETSKGDYISRKGVYSASPHTLAPWSCPKFDPSGLTAPLKESPFPISAHILWEGAFETSLKDLQKVFEEPKASYVAKFYRVPYYSTKNSTTVVGDLRYDQTPGIDFADVLLDGSPPPKFSAPWVPPRTDLLETH